MAEECILEAIGAVKHCWQEVKIHVMKLEMRAVVVFQGSGEESDEEDGLE
jgi:hypothetical protein